MSTGAFADNVSAITVEYIADGSTQPLGALSDLKTMLFGNVDVSSLTPDTDVIGNASHAGISVYPNPTANSIHVDGALIRLFTIGGQLVKATTDTDVDISQLPAGNYLLQTGVNVIKILKNKTIMYRC